jgi:hypothetical protein
MTSKQKLWVSYIMTALPVLMLLFSGMMKLMKPPAVVEGFAHLGYDDSVARALGLVELLSALLCVIPRTSVLGAILLTGYLGARQRPICGLASRSIWPFCSGCWSGGDCISGTSACAY